ncbi:MAG: glycosyltransferase [Ferruginibacter sp.]|nr:glycosyltransferase [Cytophagales bacterium]
MTTVSIVTAVYNGSSTLAQTIESVLSQTYPHLEHIIVDGASRDNTVDIIRGYEGKIARWVSEPDRGIYDAMNKGLRLATGDIIGILNADDFYESAHVISKVVALFERERVEVLYGDLLYVDADHPEKIVRYWEAKSYRENAFRRGWMPPHPTFFVKRGVYQRHGLFDERFRCSADYEMMLRLIHKHRLQPAYLPEVLVRMRTGGVSNQSLKSRLVANREDYLAWASNGLKPAFYTMWLKPLRKLYQYLVRPRRQ